MAYEVSNIAVNLKGLARGLSAVRTMGGGMLYVVHYDDTSSPKRCKAWYSIGDGRPTTWLSESWSQNIGGPPLDVPPYTQAGDGGKDPVLLCDLWDRIWLACSSYGGVDSPHALMRNAEEEVWGRARLDFSGFHRFTNRTGVTSFDAAMDQWYATAGVWNICCVYIDGGKVYYSDFGKIDHQVDANTNYTACRIVVTTNGHKVVFMRDSAGDLWASWGTGAFSSINFAARVQVNAGGTSVTSLEDCCLVPKTWPACIYRQNVGGVEQLWLAEWDGINSVWIRERVWDGTHDYDFFSGQALEFDQRGSVFVTGPYDHDDDGSNGRIYQWNQIRAEGASTWTGYDRQPSGAGGTIAQSVALKARTPFLNGYMPNYLEQGLLWFTYGWASGASQTQQSLDMANNDYFGNADTTYPTILSRWAGEPFYRLPDTTTRTVQKLDHDKAPKSSFPSIKPSFSVKRGHVFKTNEMEFRAGYSAQFAKFTSEQQLITVVFDNVPGDADKDTVVDYAHARQKDGKSFYWYPDDEEHSLENAITVEMWPSPIVVERGTNADGEGVWVVGFQMLEVRS